MRKGKYFQYSKIIVNHLYQNDFLLEFSLYNRCSHLALSLKIPKTSFYDVLRWLEEEKIIEIRKRRIKLYDGLIVEYFSRLKLTREGLSFYFGHLLEDNSDL